MKTAKKSFNPFYFLLVVTGIIFCITSCAYLVLTVRGRVPEAPPVETGLLGFMDRHGVTMLMCELAALTLFTFAAMGTDSYWEKDTQRIEPKHESTE